MAMHARKATAGQLKAVLTCLRRNRKYGASTKQLSDAAHTYCVSTAVSELRHRGYEIGCLLLSFRPRVYRYFLREEKNG
jgi:hypothetical protein